MRKKLISVVMTVLFLYSMVNPLTMSNVSAASNTNIQGVETRNVALNAKVTASGQCNNNEGAGFAVDGKSDTKWCDNSSAKEKWLALDLGQVYNINEWVVKNAGISESNNTPFWNTKDFRLQKSIDGVKWEDVDVVTDNVQTIVDSYVSTFSAQYVRLYINKAAYDNNTVRLYELEVYGVESDQIPAYPATNLMPVDYVDPFINTLGDNGQTNPGATTPFGLVALGPDSDGGAFSGYYYQDKYLKGFTHLRFSGAGCSGAGGNILMMPETRSFTKNSNEYKQKYDKSSEEASPGYYSVKLESGIEVELTTSKNVGLHRYTFPKVDTGSVLIDLSNSYAGMVDANLTVENNNEISGMIQSKNVCGNGYYTMYYSIQFDHNFDSYTSWQGDTVGTESKRTGSNSGVWANFNTKDNKVIQAKVGLSTISVEQAKYERSHDAANGDFDVQHELTRSAWSDVLNKVEITDADEENKRVFYTQLYHSFLHPNNVTSSNGTFKAARDENTIRQTSQVGPDFEYYNGWATWDDFRKYSLFSLLEPKKYENMVKSMVDVYNTRGSYTQWGDGYWPSPTVRNEFNGAVILDAYSKGFDNFDVNKALKGMSIDADNFSISDGEISGKLEKANSAYFPMKLAELIGDKDTYEKYKNIALSYKQLWNPTQVDEKGDKRGFFTPNGKTVAKGDILAVDKYAYQGNLWTYRWAVPQDVNGLADLLGGKRKMAEELQHFFKIDEYMAINEPDLQVPYLFNYLGYPYLTQYYAREYTTEVVTQKYHNHGTYAYPIKSRVYRADPEGYLPSMDDDAGGMSSWFVYSAMGLFPGNPGEAYYMIGSPIFSELKMHLGNGKTFTIKANNVSSKNRFIKSAKLEGKNFNQAWIKYEDIMSGGTLEFEMDSEPNTSWGAAASAAPPTTDFTADVNNTLVRQELIAKQSNWKYFDKEQSAGDNWTSLKYDDSDWASGLAMLGYDNFNKVNTKISFGPSSSNKYPTAYFRKTFEVSDVNDIIQLDASLIRDDGAVVYLNGHEIIRTNMPAGEVKYNTFANGTVGDERDWNGYPINLSYLVKGTNILTAEVHQVNATSSDIAFDFSLEAVKMMEKPVAPTEPIVEDKANTFGWKPVSGFDLAADYEYSTDNGLKWKPVTSNPQTVGPLDYEAGKVQVRVKANESLKQSAGHTLASNAAFTSDIKWDVYDLKADVDRKGNMIVDVTGTLKGSYVDSAVVVFQLMDGNEKALMSSAVPVEIGSFQLSQIYNLKASKYQVNVYLVDAYNGNIYDSLWLAEPIELQPEPVLVPNPKPPVEDEPLPDPLPLPEDEPNLPNEPGEPGEGQPGEEGMTIQFENRSEWSSALNTFNNNPLKTEAGNGGTVVANTFDGAWFSYTDVEFGTEGKNQIAMEYDAPSEKAPANIVAEIRLGSLTGDLVGTVKLPNTGSGWGTYKSVKADLTTTVIGKQNLYIVMKGSTDSAHPYVGNLDLLTFGYKAVRADYAKLELETYNEWSTDNNPYNGNTPLKTEAGKSGLQVENTFSGAWLAYKGMNFGSKGINQLSIEYSGNSVSVPADAAVEVRLGGVEGTLVGKIATPPTASGWGTYKTAIGDLTQTLTGIQDIYLVLTGTTNSTYKYIGNFDNASFSLSVLVPVEPEVKGTIQFENRSEWSSAVNTFNNNPLKTETANGRTVIANTFDGAWFSYTDVDFGTEGKNHIEIVYDAPSDKAPANVVAEIRLGGITGELMGTVGLPNTGSGWGTYKSALADLTTTVTGMQNLYIVMKGSTDSTHPYVGNPDRLILDYQAVRTDFAKLELETYNEWSADKNPYNSNLPLKTENGKSGLQVANTFSGAWLAYKRVDFGRKGTNQFSIEYSGNSLSVPVDAAVEVRLGGVNGTLVGKVATPPTASGWGTYKTVISELTQTLTGIQDVYLVFTGTTSATYKYIGNFDNASFSLIEQESAVTVEFEGRTEWTTAKNTFNNNTLKTEANNGGTVVGNTFNDAWLLYKDVDFGIQGKNYVEITYDAPSTKAPANVVAEFRLNNNEGEIIGMLNLPNTGSGWGTYKTIGARLDQKLIGNRTICVVLKGSTTSSLLYVGNLDRMKFSVVI